MLGRLGTDEIKNVLRNNILGRLGCTIDNKSYIVPVNFVYDDHSIIAHSVYGKKIEIMRQNPKVCFQVDDIKDHRNWRSVILWGTYIELMDEKDRLESMKKFVERLLYMKISETAVAPETTTTRTHPRSPGNIKPIIYRIEIEEMTGRYEIE